MATSGVITGTLTARQIVTAAMEEIGYHDANIPLDASDAATGLRVLNWMLKSWQTEGLTNRWRLEEVSISWTAGVTEATLNTNYLDLFNLRVRDSNNVDRLLEPLSSKDYAEIPNKSTSGTPVAYNIRKTNSTIALRLWPVPTATTSLYAEGVRIIEDLTNLAEHVDVPQEWLETVYINLADRLPLSFKAGLTPIERQELAQRAASLRRLLKVDDAETGSVFFGVAG